MCAHPKRAARLAGLRESARRHFFLLVLTNSTHERDWRWLQAAAGTVAGATGITVASGALAAGAATDDFAVRRKRVGNSPMRLPMFKRNFYTAFLRRLIRGPALST